MATEAQVSADPTGRRFALLQDDTLEVVDSLGRTTSHLAGVASARFTATGDLVTLDRGGTPDWLRPQ
jgi:hypothetical protein